MGKGVESPLRRFCGTICTPSSIDVGTWAKEPTSQLAPSLAPSSSRRNWLGKRHNVCTISFTKTTTSTTTNTTTTTTTTKTTTKTTTTTITTTTTTTATTTRTTKTTTTTLTMTTTRLPSET